MTKTLHEIQCAAHETKDDQDCDCKALEVDDAGEPVGLDRQSTSGDGDQAVEWRAHYPGCSSLLRDGSAYACDCAGDYEGTPYDHLVCVICGAEAGALYDHPEGMRPLCDECEGLTSGKVVELDTAPPLDTVGVDEDKTLYQFAYALTAVELEALEETESIRALLSRTIKARLRTIEVGLEVPMPLGPPTDEDYADDDAHLRRRQFVAAHTGHLVGAAVRDCVDAMRDENDDLVSGDMLALYAGLAAELSKVDTELRAAGISQDRRRRFEKMGRKIGYDLSRPNHDWKKLAKEHAAKQSRGRNRRGR